MNEVNIFKMDKDSRKGKGDPVLKAVFWVISP